VVWGRGDEGRNRGRKQKTEASRAARDKEAGGIFDGAEAHLQAAGNSHGLAVLAPLVEKGAALERLQ